MDISRETSSAAEAGPNAAGFRDQLTKLQGLVGLSMVMTERTDPGEIAKLAACRVVVGVRALRRDLCGEARAGSRRTALLEAGSAGSRRETTSRPSRTVGILADRGGALGLGTSNAQFRGCDGPPCRRRRRTRPRE